MGEVKARKQEATFDGRHFKAWNSQFSAFNPHSFKRVEKLSRGLKRHFDQASVSEAEQSCRDYIGGLSRMVPSQSFEPCLVALRFSW